MGWETFWSIFPEGREKERREEKRDREEREFEKYRVRAILKMNYFLIDVLGSSVELQKNNCKIKVYSRVK